MRIPFQPHADDMHRIKHISLPTPSTTSQTTSKREASHQVLRRHKFPARPLPYIKSFSVQQLAYRLPHHRLNDQLGHHAASSNIRPVASPASPRTPACLDGPPAALASPAGVADAISTELWKPVPAAGRVEWECFWRIWTVHERPNSTSRGAIRTDGFQAWTGVHGTKRM